MVEPRIVVPVVAGSSPVGHPRRGFRLHLLPSGSLKGIDLLCRLNLPARIQRRLEDGTLPKKVSSKPAHIRDAGLTCMRVSQHVLANTVLAYTGPQMAFSVTIRSLVFAQPK
jgi:hypothetical protein